VLIVFALELEWHFSTFKKLGSLGIPLREKAIRSFDSILEKGFTMCMVIT